MKTILFITLFCSSTLAWSSTQTLLSSIGINIQTSCGLLSCETVQCYDSTFKDCDGENLKVKTKCKKKELKDISFRVEKLVETIQVCKDFTPYVHAKLKSFLRVQDYFQPKFQAAGQTLLFKFTNGTNRPYANINKDMRYVLFTGSALNYNYGHPHEEELAVLVGCHEVGHFLAGTPQFKLNGEIYSSEGQADSFAYHGCAQSMFTESENTNFVKNNIIDSKIQARCQETQTTQANKNQCEHIATLIYETYKILNPDVDIDTPDTNLVTRTLSNVSEYPTHQCGLDNALSATFNYPGDGSEFRLPCWFKAN